MGKKKQQKKAARRQKALKRQIQAKPKQRKKDVKPSDARAALWDYYHNLFTEEAQLLADFANARLQTLREEGVTFDNIDSILMREARLHVGFYNVRHQVLKKRIIRFDSIGVYQRASNVLREDFEKNWCAEFDGGRYQVDEAKVSLVSQAFKASPQDINPSSVLQAFHGQKAYQLVIAYMEERKREKERRLDAMQLEFENRMRQEYGEPLLETPEYTGDKRFFYFDQDGYLEKNEANFKEAMRRHEVKRRLKPEIEVMERLLGPGFKFDGVVFAD